ncbi:mucin-5AC-like [Ictalurus furcatus]|uniref:mucin-5AC-like n=1 Tax=Ictalurus furcatus TaxID=66913 RepID=UPI00235059BC|nr:mucin-5AC-like [Ictalurus furcatus]
MLLSVQYMDRELTLSCPAVQPPATTPLPAHMYVPHVHMGYPFPYGSCITWHFHSRDPGASTDAPMTTLATTVAPASAGQLPLYPWLRGLYYPSGYGMPWNFPYGHPGAPPVTQTTTTTPATTSTPAAATTSTPAATVAPASAGQLPLYPWLSGMYYPSGYGMPWNFPYGHPGAPPVTQTTTTTPATTSTPAAATTSTPAATVAPASAGQLPLYPWLSGMYYPSGYGMPWNFPYGHPGTPPVTQTTTATTTTTVAPASADQPLLYPWLPGMYKPYVPMGSPGAPVSGPNSGVKQQMYQMPWMNAFPPSTWLEIKRQALQWLTHPNLSGPANFSPLQVGARPGK